MKITNLRTHFLTRRWIDDSWFPFALHSTAVIRIETDVALDGLGEVTWGYFAPEAVPAVVDYFKPLVERALAEALQAGHLAQAVVDCYKGEPLRREHFFFDVPNLIMTPHMSGVFAAFWPAMLELLGENLRRFRSGAALLNQAHGAKGY